MHALLSSQVPDKSAYRLVSENSDFLSEVQASVKQAADCLISNQRSNGHWVAELEGDTILESEFILMMAFLGREKDPLCLKAAKFIENQQIDGGGWTNYFGGPMDVSVSVKAYFALKITGTSSDIPWMRRIKDRILASGGAEACNSFTRFYLALLGQYPYHNCPEVPPEIMLLPNWFPLSIYKMSSWTRTILVPLSIFSAFKPKRDLPSHMGIRELFLEAPEKPRWPAKPDKSFLAWGNFFLGVDWLLKRMIPLFPSVRKKAVSKAAKWMREHFQQSDGVGAIFPPMIYTVIALKCLGVPEDSEEFKWALKQLLDLVIEEDGTARLQPCVSPVWDTALASIAVADAGDPSHNEFLQKSMDWLLSKEVKLKGDWAISNPDLKPGGWFFEYENAFYPDVDDSVMVILAMVKAGKAKDIHFREAICRSAKWLLGMQNKDGGWGAFDKDIDQEFLTKVPFADHNAMLDPTCPDISARVLEALGSVGIMQDNINVRNAINYIRTTQETWGAWIGRWGVNYIYGTWQVLQGLNAVGFDSKDPMVQKAVAWLKNIQQPNGAWGETCATYDDPTLAGTGAPTPSQTAWAILGLLSAGEHKSEAVRRGINYLVRTQRQDGNWDELHHTGTGFPKVFYLKYHYYRLYFPLMALSRFLRKQGYECVV